MPYDPKDPAKDARRRLTTAVLDKVLEFFQREFKLPDHPQERKALSTLISLAIDPYVKTGNEALVDVAVKAWTDVKIKLA